MISINWTWKQIYDRLSNYREEGDARLKLGSYLKAEISSFTSSLGST